MRVERATDEQLRTIPLPWHCDIQPSEYTIYRGICKYCIFSEPSSSQHTHTLTRTRLIVPFKRQNENSISLCRQKMEREKEMQRNERFSSEQKAGIFSNYSASFPAIPQGKLWRTGEPEEKVAPVYQYQGPPLFFLPGLWSPHIVKLLHTHRLKNLQQEKKQKIQKKTRQSL